MLCVVPALPINSYNLVLIILLCRTVPRLCPLCTQRSLFSRTYSLNPHVMQCRRITAKNEGSRANYSSERDAHLSGWIKTNLLIASPCLSITGEASEHRRADYEMEGAPGLRKFSAIPSARSSCCIPQLPWQRPETRQSTRISQSERCNGLGDLRQREVLPKDTTAYEAGKPTHLGRWGDTGTPAPRRPPRSAPEDTQYNSTLILLGHLCQATHFRHLLDWSLKTGFAGYF